MTGDPHQILGRRVQIAGSASKRTEAATIRYAHRLVNHVVRGVLKLGGGLVLAAGREPRAIDGDNGSPSLLFDWTALESALDLLKEGVASWPASAGAPIVIVTSEKAELEIPPERRALWKQLLDTRKVRVESIFPGSRAAAFIRERQAEFGEVLITLGGGTGVEHLAELYQKRRKSVIPLDLPLGASRGDGTGGSEGLARESRAEPSRFVRMRKELHDRSNTLLAGLSTKSPELDTDLGDRILNLLVLLAPPSAFYVRLLNKDHERFATVEKFFRSVVDTVVAQAGFDRIEMGTDATEHGFMNVAIFESIHFANAVVVDVTGLRPNCFIELGYALRATRVIVTAEEGTTLPFDQNAIPCYFWREDEPDNKRQDALSEFWRKNIDRPTLVPDR
jgi:TIR- and PNP-associating SLOG family